MAKKVTVTLLDDMDGKTSAEHEGVSFSIDGVEYEIDLSSSNYNKLHEMLDPWKGKARKISSRRQKAAVGKVDKAARDARKDELADIRVWAQKHGHKVSARGRVSAEIQAAYASRGKTVPAAAKPAVKPAPAVKRAKAATPGMMQEPVKADA